MAGSITVAKFRDVANGLQAGQFAVGDRVKIKGLSDLDPIYKALLDRPITVTLGLIGPDGRIGMTPMWFDYEGDKVLVNTASHRAKCGWIRKNPKLTILIVNPENAYHWVHAPPRSSARSTKQRRAASVSPGSSTRSGLKTRATRRQWAARSRDRRKARAVHLQRRSHRDLRQTLISALPLRRNGW